MRTVDECWRSSIAESGIITAPTPGHERERILALRVVGAAELEDLDRAPAHLSVEDVAQHGDVVGDELFDAESRDRSVLLQAFGGEHRRHAQRLQRRRDAKELAADDRFV